jgi:hypothetical protein
MKYIVSLGISALVALMVISCESSSDLDGNSTSDGATTFRMSPAGHNLYSNVVVNLEVIGGNPPFTFALSDPDMGTVTSTNTLTRVISYRPKEPFIAGANTIRVFDERRWTAHSIITQIPTP